MRRWQALVMQLQAASVCSASDMEEAIVRELGTQHLECNGSEGRDANTNTRVSVHYTPVTHGLDKPSYGINSSILSVHALRTRTRAHVE